MKDCACWMRLEPRYQGGVGIDGVARRIGPGARGAGAFVNRQFVTAALVATAVLAIAGAAEASTATSPAPRRAAASPLHSAAGASATATHAAVGRHGRKHHRHRLHRLGEGAQSIIATQAGSAAGGSPPLPARHPYRNHHATLTPAPNVSRPLARSGGGSAADTPAAAAVWTAMSRLEICPFPEPMAHEDRLTSGRGPPRAGPCFIAFASPRLQTSSSSHPPNTPEANPSHNPDFQSFLSRDRHERRPHANRPEGAVVCSDSPSIGDPS